MFKNYPPQLVGTRNYNSLSPSQKENSKQLQVFKEYKDKLTKYSMKQDGQNLKKTYSTSYIPSSTFSGQTRYHLPLIHRSIPSDFRLSLPVSRKKKKTPPRLFGP